MENKNKIKQESKAPNVTDGLGLLTSEVSITLHSSPATRLWDGKFLRQGKSRTSMPIMLSLLNNVHRDAQYDDPFADLFLMNFEEMVEKNINEMNKLNQDLMDLFISDLPDCISLERCQNISPVTFNIYSRSPLGFKMLALLGLFDELAVKAMTAQHMALLTRNESQQWINTGATLIRRCYGTLNNYRHTGLTREDVKSNSLRYQEVVKNFGFELPKEIIEGTVRARFAPVIRKNANRYQDVQDEQENQDETGAERVEATEVAND